MKWSPQFMLPVKAIVANECHHPRDAFPAFSNLPTILLKLEAPLFRPMTIDLLFPSSIPTTSHPFVPYCRRMGACMQKIAERKHKKASIKIAEITGNCSAKQEGLQNQLLQAEIEFNEWYTRGVQVNAKQAARRVADLRRQLSVTESTLQAADTNRFDLDRAVAQRAKDEMSTSTSSALQFYNPRTASLQDNARLRSKQSSKLDSVDYAQGIYSNDPDDTENVFSELAQKCVLGMPVSMASNTAHAADWTDTELSSSDEDARGGGISASRHGKYKSHKRHHRGNPDPLDRQLMDLDARG